MNSHMIGTYGERPVRNKLFTGDFFKLQLLEFMEFVAYLFTLYYTKSYIIVLFVYYHFIRG